MRGDGRQDNKLVWSERNESGSGRRTCDMGRVSEGAKE